LIRVNKRHTYPDLINYLTLRAYILLCTSSDFIIRATLKLSLTMMNIQIGRIAVQGHPRSSCQSKAHMQLPISH